MLTIGWSLLMKGLAILLWGKEVYTLTSIEGSVHFAGAYVAYETRLAFFLLIILGSTLWLFFSKTLFGKTFLAVCENTKAAILVGIPVNKVILGSFVLSAILCAVIGMFISPIILIDYQMGTSLGIKGFAAAMIGGLGSFPAAVFGGLFLGILESFSVAFIHSSYKDFVSLSMLLLVLFFSPNGLFGKKAIRFS